MMGSPAAVSPTLRPAVPSLMQVCSWPLPHLAKSGVTRWALRALCVVARTRVLEMDGLTRILPDRDPFILALNHTQRVEALLVPALLTLLRGGRMIHFLSDWNFRLVPGVGQLFAAGETILITRKSARPRVLNLFKPLYSEPTSGFVRARRRLERGAAVGIFPEGTVNPDPVRLLRGRRGAAWLSLTTGVPIVPAGIRFPRSSLARRVSEFAPLSLSIGEPMEPPVLGQVPPLVEVRAWHEAIMRRIAALCDKAWHPSNRRDAR